MLLASRAWLTWSQGKDPHPGATCCSILILPRFFSPAGDRDAAAAAMQAAADYADGGFGPEVGQVWHPYEMIAEMRMQMGQPGLALEALNKVMKAYPNRFNSIAAAAAAAAALESSSSPATALSPTAASLYAQLLALVSSAPALRAATTGVPGKPHTCIIGAMS